jgi:hypothetical protein
MIPAHPHAGACKPWPALIIAGMIMFCSAAHPTLLAQDPPLPRATALRMLRVVPSGTGAPTTVVLEADGPLPDPTSEPLDGPPRIYLDLPGVVPAPTITRTGIDSRILRVRVARHSDSPIVTRVVLDLSSPSPYHVDAAARAEGRLVIVLADSGATTTRPAHPDATSRAVNIPNVPLPSLPNASAARPRPAPSARSSAASRNAETSARRYALQITAAVERLDALRPVLAAIDNRSEALPDLPATATEFEAIGHLLAAIKPPPPREATHALLVRTCALGALASRTLQESVRTGDSAGRWNAASAAAGALMLLDRAIKDLGQERPL